MPAPAAAAPTLYVHVPFCVVKCGYCDFNSYEVQDRSALDRFLAGLVLELERTPLPAAPPSVFFGGGTPTFLDPPRFAQLFEIVGRHVDLAACPEVSCEANPESTTEEKAVIALHAGVDRFSVGAQSFDAAALRFLDRAHDADATRAAVAGLRAAGVERLGLDLMFGLPGQRLEAWDRDLDAALELGPDHLSCYNLTFEPGTRLTREHAAGRVAANPDEIDRRLFLHTRSKLTAAGFTAYEVSNFAGRAGPCRHNDHYWLQGDYVGVGPGAASHRAGVRHTNLKPVEAWCRSLEAGIPPVAEAETLTPRQRAAEALWLGIRRADGVDLGAVEHRVGVAMSGSFEPEIQRLEAEGLVTRAGDALRLTDQGLLFADTVGERLLGA